MAGGNHVTRQAVDGFTDFGSWPFSVKILWELREIWVKSRCIHKSLWLHGMVVQT